LRGFCASIDDVASIRRRRSGGRVAACFERRTWLRDVGATFRSHVLFRIRLARRTPNGDGREQEQPKDEEGRRTKASHDPEDTARLPPKHEFGR
jgi:hypothetical protein